ncbi:hypothetical protein EV182_005143 [Spiromyces aspiralis]|uniref:Uncharacterized protein n=1 Tax=Spiromyces aspiralis TaxID=68401 RepID=A0ACC1HAF8_9FUNG|nr:hypothetical protein EV182_005143 [Spiromyces aspiralis]
MSCFEEFKREGHCHDHGHGGGHDHDHDHSHDSEEVLKDSLFTKIDLDNVRCMNEKEKDSIKGVFKPWDERMDVTKYVDSDADEQLIIHIPFTGQVKLKSILIRGGPDGTAPRTMKVYSNRPGIDFDNVESEKPSQVFSLVQAPNNAQPIEYNTNVIKFRQVTHLTLFFADNFGEDTTRILYIGLKGDWIAVKQKTLSGVVYEATPNLKDHDVPANANAVSRFVG